MESFRKLVEKEVEKRKFSTIMVDNMHIYGIIEIVVKELCQSIIDENTKSFLKHLVNLSALAELSAEQLGLASSTCKEDEDNYKELLIDTIRTIESRKEKSPSLQKGVERFSFSFNQLELEELKKRIH